MQLEYVRIHVIYGVNQAEYRIHILVVAPQEYVNLYSTRRSNQSRATTSDQKNPNLSTLKVPCSLAFTRYCHHQCCMVYAIQKGGRGRALYCLIAVQ